MGFPSPEDDAQLRRDARRGPLGFAATIRLFVNGYVAFQEVSA